MKRFKAIACVLCVAMLAGIFAGCSKTTKITTEKFDAACDKLGFDQYDPDDDDAPDMDALEDGFYCVVDEDYIEDNEDSLDSTLQDIGLDKALHSELGFGNPDGHSAVVLQDIGLDDVFEAEDIKSFAFAAKCTGLDGFEDITDVDDIADLEVDGAFALQMSLNDDKCAEDFMDYVEDMLDNVDISAKDLTAKEFYTSKNEGYFRFHVDLAKFGALILENDDIMDMFDEYDIDSDDFEEAIGALTGDIAVSIEISGSEIFIIAGISINSKTETLDSFCKSFGAVSNPKSVPMNEKVCEEIVDNLSDNAGDLFYYIYMAQLYSSSYSG